MLGSTAISRPQRSEVSAISSDNGAIKDVLSLNLPKGGGAISGIGEKITSNPVTGSASLTIPVPVSTGRGGFTPELQLSYEAGTSSGIFGFGWSLSLPEITRKTEKGLPQYDDAAGSDVFLISGSEDLVPLLDSQGVQWEDRARFPGVTIHRFRPRIESTFARIERWTDEATGIAHWRVTSRENVTSIYGASGLSRVADPNDPARVFRWLLSETFDDKGNAIRYEHVAEDAVGIDQAQAHEANRSRTAERYLKRIRYGNRVSRLVDPDVNAGGWLFTVVFDYGEDHLLPIAPDPNVATDAQHELVHASSDPGRNWQVRPDPTSSYRAGFEVRRYRRCHRILTFHNIPDLPTGEPGYRGLVKATEFSYDDFTPPGADTDDERQHPGSTRYGSFLMAVAQSGFAPDDTVAPRDVNGATFLAYRRQAIPPVEFTYNRAEVNDIVHGLDREQTEGAPAGLTDPANWVDLDGDGVGGILTSTPVAWHYTRNLGPMNGTARFAAPVLVAERPAFAESGQWMDLAGDGRPDLVVMDRTTPGFHERDAQSGWSDFRAFEYWPHVDASNDSMKMVDLTGDGLADILLTEDTAFVWHPSEGEAGFGPARRQAQPWNDTDGPRLVFSDPEAAIFLADMSGDGLSDLVRIRCGEVAYWPNCGYGRFGTKVAMDDAPQFDRPEMFDRSRLRLTDIDGSGTTDIVYLGAEGIDLYFNMSGNRLAPRRRLGNVPPLDTETSVDLLDLFGTGTACLVWSYTLSRDAGQPLRYVDLMGGQKPHLMTRYVNNFGGETELRYASSSRFYLQDLYEGRPWATRLPFPVQVVDRIVTHDRVAQTRFVSRFAFHHGHFDGVEREFRGFGMVEQWDTEEFATLSSDALGPLASNEDPASHVPPVLTRTWFHTGVYLDQGSLPDVLAGLLDGQDRGEYWRAPAWRDDDVDARRRLLPDTVLPPGLTTGETREAARALRGTVLRRETYALDGRAEPGYPNGHPYQVVEQTQTVHLLQSRGPNRHAVFLTHARESLTAHYERIPDDPRLQHQVILEVDPFGTELRRVDVMYGRQTPDPTLTPEDQVRQAQLYAVLHTRRVTDLIATDQTYRAPVSCEEQSFELTGLSPAPGTRLSFDEIETEANAAADLAYEATSTAGQVQRRLIEHRRQYFRDDTLTGPLPLGQMGSLGLLHQSFQLAFTPGLVTQVYGGRVGAAEMAQAGYTEIDGDGQWWRPSDRQLLSPSSGDTPAQELAFARQHFFRPHRLRDPFHQPATHTETTARYDAFDLLIEETQDALGNRMSAGVRSTGPAGAITERRQDYRVLQASVLTDENGNRSEVVFDAYGRVTGMARMGKVDGPDEGDRLDGFDPTLVPAARTQVLTNPRGPEALVALGRATMRYVYDPWAYYHSRGDPVPSPVIGLSLHREVHDSDLLPGQTTPFLAELTFTDGMGQEIQRKIQAEDGPVPTRDGSGNILLGPDGRPVMSASPSPRWVGTGWQVRNNKGNIVRQFEPFFTDRPTYESDIRIGVSPIFFYDALGREIGILNPDHTWSKHRFSVWDQTTWDPGDTVLISDPAQDPDLGDHFRRLPQAAYLPTWHALRTDPAQVQALATRFPDPEDRQRATEAASKSALYDDTPMRALADTRGALIARLTPNRTLYSNAAPGTLPTETLHRVAIEIDIEGNTRRTWDELGREVQRTAFDMLSTAIRTDSMEGGTRWRLTDVGGETAFTWDARDHRLRHEFDVLRRPIATHLSINAGPELRIDETIYGESLPTPEALNHRKRIAISRDQSGTMEILAHDFKGNPIRSQRQLAQEFRTTLDWTAPVATEPEIFAGQTRFDALDRPVQLVPLQPQGPGARIQVVQYRYNPSTRLDRVDTWHARPAAPDTLLDPATADHAVVTGIAYNPWGDRERITYGNAVETEILHDPLTRLTERIITRRDAIGFGSDCPTPPVAGWPGCHLQAQHMIYDVSGHVTHIRDSAQQQIFFRNRRVDASNDYTFDALHRLIEATGREHLGQQGGAPGAHSYNDAARTRLPHRSDGFALGRYLERFHYDIAGNLIEMRHRGSDPVAPGWTRTYTYGEDSDLAAGVSSNRLSQTSVGALNDIISQGGDGYDAMGNMLRLSHLDQIEWDHDNQLRMCRRQAVGPGDTDGLAHQGDRTFFVYASDGTRIRKVTETAAGAIRRETISLGGFDIIREPGANPRTRETLHVGDEAGRIALVETTIAGGAVSRVIRYQHSNHVGSVGIELDENGNVLSYEEYSPFGSTTYQGVATAGLGPKRFRYTAMERDAETGLNHHGARYAAPWLGRWISADPIGIEGGLNLYAYAYNNPVTLNDPEGTAPPTVPNGGLEVASLQKGLETLDALATQVRNTEGSVQEFALIKENNTFKILKGTATKPEVSIPKGTTAIAHTHPPTAMVSFADVNTTHAQGVKVAGVRSHLVAHGNGNWTLIEIPKQGNGMLTSFDTNTGMIKGTVQVYRPGAAPDTASMVQKVDTMNMVNKQGKITSISKLAKAMRGSKAVSQTLSGGRAILGVMGRGLMVIGMAASGIQVGTGITQIAEGETGVGTANVVEGTASGTLNVVSVSGKLVTGGGAGSVLAAGLAAFGSIALAGTEARSAIKGEKTAAREAADYWVDEIDAGHRQGGVGGFFRRSAGYLGLGAAGTMSILQGQGIKGHLKW